MSCECNSSFYLYMRCLFNIIDIEMNNIYFYLHINKVICIFDAKYYKYK